MQRFRAVSIGFVGVLCFASLVGGTATAQEPRHQLTVHLAQANNDSPYAFVRAKFEPGEVADPWAVRFFDLRGQEVPYFIWDSVTRKVAREVWHNNPAYAAVRDTLARWRSTGSNPGK